MQKSKNNVLMMYKLIFFYNSNNFEPKKDTKKDNDIYYRCDIAIENYSCNIITICIAAFTSKYKKKHHYNSTFSLKTVECIKIIVFF